jgi:hypothetical protein
VIVVTDTSVILNHCLLGLQDLLPTLFEKTHAPRTVLDEFARLANIDPQVHWLEVSGLCRSSSCLHYSCPAADHRAVRERPKASHVQRLIQPNIRVKWVGAFFRLVETVWGPTVAEIQQRP